MAAALLAIGLMTGCGSDTGEEGPDAVALEAAESPGDDAFTASVAVGNAWSEAALDATAGFRDGSAGPAVQSTTPGLYGGSGSDAICDLPALIDTLEADEALGAAWASAAGVDADAIGATVRSWTPALLSADTLVVNHGFVDGRANAFHSVLQTGTAVLVDEFGVPALRCACGNPLLEPAGSIDADTETRGDAWEGFDADRVITVEAPGEPPGSLTVTDIESGDRFDVALPDGDLTVLDAADFDNSDYLFPDYPDGTYTRGQITIVHPSGLMGCDIVTGGDAIHEWFGSAPGAVACWVSPEWLPETIGPEDELSPGMAELCRSDPDRGLEVLAGVDGTVVWACEFEVVFSSYFDHRYFTTNDGSPVTMDSEFGLPVGHAVTHQGTTCASHEDLMRCETETGHGFEIGSGGSTFF